MNNRAAKLRKHNYLEWSYVSTRNNEADLGSRGRGLRKLFAFWWDVGPKWLGDCKQYC